MAASGRLQPVWTLRMREGLRLLHYEAQVLLVRAHAVASGAGDRCPETQALLVQSQQVVRTVEKLTAAARRMLP